MFLEIYAVTSFPLVLIVGPKFLTSPKLLSSLIATTKISAPPKVDGISDVKYNSFPSTLNAGSPNEYLLFEKGSLLILLQFPSASTSALYNCSISFLLRFFLYFIAEKYTVFKSLLYAAPVLVTLLVGIPCISFFSITSPSSPIVAINKFDTESFLLSVLIFSALGDLYIN